MKAEVLRFTLEQLRLPEVRATFIGTLSPGVRELSVVDEKGTEIVHLTTNEGFMNFALDNSIVIAQR